MKLRIANLGVIKEAMIDLGRKLTVFCGPNGTGKTWAAYVIGAFFDKSIIYIYNNNKEEFDLSKIITGEGQNIEPNVRNLYDHITYVASVFSEDISHVFPVSVENKRELFRGFNITLAEAPEEFEKRFLNQSVQGIVSGFAFQDISIRKHSGSNNVFFQTSASARRLHDNENRFDIIISSALSRAAASMPIVSAYSLPVERNSVFTFSREISLHRSFYFEQVATSNGTRNKEISTLIESRHTRYPLAVREALTTAEDLNTISRNESPFYDFALEVEQSLLKGKVQIGSDGEVSFAPTKAEGKSFSFQLSSSAIKTLSSLIIYLKYQAKPNELLIIDEPELNLHPDNQILLARIFARMINKGLRLLISTHSDYIVRELNNLIMLSADEPALQQVAQDFGYRNDERISREDIGVYLFHFKNPDDQHVTVEPVEVAKNGFEVATIEETINRLNAVSEEIFYTMKYGKQVRNEQD